MGAYVASASTVLAQSAVEEGDELFLALLAHLGRRYPEAYGPAVGTCWAPDHRVIQIREEEGSNGGNSSVHISIKFGSYKGRLAKLNLAGMNNPSPNLTTLHLDTPVVVPTTDPLEYVTSPGHLGQPSGYPPTSTGAYIGGSRRHLLPHPHRTTLTHRYTPPLVGSNHTG